MKRTWLLALVAVLGLAVIGMGTALAITISGDDDGNATTGAAAGQYAGCGMGWGMMAGRGDWTPESMRSYMRSVLGEEDYQRMLDYMRAYANGQDVSGYRGTGPMWQMMGAMMQGWSQNDWNRCWGWMMR